ncbi:transposase [Trichothermofontia sp.]
MVNPSGPIGLRDRPQSGELGLGNGTGENPQLRQIGSDLSDAEWAVLAPLLP